MPLYFAYASNLSTRQMDHRCRSRETISRAALQGYRLDFPRRSYRPRGRGVAGVVPDAGGSDRGVVYDISDDDLARLDRAEGVPKSYVRRRVTVEPRGGGTLEVWTYFANPEPGAPFRPSREYLDVILEGAREHGLDADYIAALEAIET